MHQNLSDLDLKLFSDSSR